VEAQAEGEVPEETAGYTLRLAAEDHAPMPTEEQTYDLHMPGPGTAVFPTITFDKLGTYHYQLSLLPGTDKDAKYDDILYDLSISVLRDESTDEWYTMMSIRNAETHEKTDVPVFIIVYPEPEITPTATPTATPTPRPGGPGRVPTATPTPTPTPEPTTTSVTVRKVWNDNNNAAGLRPNSLRVTLSNGMSITLNAANGWTATISNLPTEENGKAINYTWREAEVLGYTQTGYTVSGTETTITNSLWSRPTPPPDIPVPGRPEMDIPEYDTPLGIGVEINHVGDTFD
ncbi:MAG: Cna B-type domain-containing protein, partial [Clostridia bacterium]|nr:Cna B-type domain-containing protein [Clostridia bacterium]